MLLKLYQSGQPILRKTAKRVTKQSLNSQHTQNVIDYMIATLRDAPGVGLSAPQVGESLQIIIIEDKPEYHETVPKALLSEQDRKPTGMSVLVNPTLEVINAESVVYFEGCLSIEGYCGVVPRAKEVKVSAWDRECKEVSFIAHGWQARILQHELDHLHGKLYIDAMISQSFTSIKNFTLLWRKALESDIRSAFCRAIK